MPGLSVHVVDVTRGKPAQGMRVEIFSLVHGRELIASGQLAANGVLEDPIIEKTLEKGAYEVVFHAGAFFASLGLEQTDPPFLNDVPFRFTIADPQQHFHLPMKMTPWGFSLYRGA